MPEKEKMIRGLPESTTIKTILVCEDTPIYIDPRKAQSEHMPVIDKCGTFGHHRIVEEMLSEELKEIIDEELKKKVK